MALRYQQSERELSPQGSILLADGTTYALYADNIVRYSLDEASTSGESITLGDARASDYTLEIEDTAHYLTAAKLIGARVTVQIGLDGVIDPLGVWYVDKAEISRQSATVSISGTDALGSKMDGLYVDGVYPTTLGAIAAGAAAQAGLTLKSNSFRNSDIVVQTQPEWDVETTTQRMVIGYVAACAGGFARISRSGYLEIVPYTMAAPETVTADYFTTLAVGGGQTFAFNCLQVAHYGSNIFVRYAIDESKTDTAGNTLRVSDNPLLTAEIAQMLKNQLATLISSAVTVDWVGDPTMQPGMRITVQDTDGSTHTGIVTRQTISVDGGLHAQTAAELPENINSAFIDTVFTPGGKVNISAAEGRLKVWAEEQIELTVGDKTEELQSQIDMIPGQITAAVEDAEKGLQAQIDLIPDQITLKVQETVPGEVESALDGYTPTGIVDGSQLIITKEQTHIDTPQFSVNVNGTNGDMTLDENGLAADVITSPSVRPMYTGPAQLYVVSSSTNGIDYFLTLADAFAKLNGKYLPYDVSIQLGITQIEGAIDLFYTDGAPITIEPYRNSDGSYPTINLNAHIAISHTRNQIYISDVNIGFSGGDNVIMLQDCYSVICSGCKFTTSRTLNTWSNAFYANQSHVEFYSCGFFGGYAGLFIEKNAHAVVDSCYGSGNDYGIFARNNAQIGVVTSRPYGAAGTYATADSVVRGATATSTGTAPEDTIVATAQISFVASASRTHDGGGWYNSDTSFISQGEKDNGHFRGYMWFSTTENPPRTLVAALDGKKIVRAAIKIYRRSGYGKRGAVPVYIGTMKCAAPGQDIDQAYEYDNPIGLCEQKEQLYANVPSNAIQAIASYGSVGGYNGLFIHGGSEQEYAAFDGAEDANPPRLVVEYEL